MDLLDKFEEAARGAAATVQRLSRDPALIATAVERASPPSPRIAIAKSHDLPAELLDGCRKLPGVFAGRSKTELAAADVGVTEAFAGIAASGSLCVSADEGDTGYISLLACTQIAIVDAKTLVPRLSDLFRRSNGFQAPGLSRNFVFVTGPSATADMGPLVRGVHGPHQLHIIILE